MVPSSVWWMCLAAFTKLWNIGRHLVRYSRRSPRLWINKWFLCFESINATAEVNSWSISGSGWAFWPPLCCFSPLFCSSPTFVLFTPLKIDPKGVISPTFRTTGLSQSFFSCLQANEVINKFSRYSMTQHQILTHDCRTQTLQNSNEKQYCHSYIA